MIKITLIKGGDITKVKADAIVNAANYQLKGGSGVCGAIYKASGSVRPGKFWTGPLVDETDQLGPISTGTSVASGPHDLAFNTKAIIHSVGPVWENGLSGEAILLASTYKSAMKIAIAEGYKSIAFPCISTGVYGYPHDLAAKIAVETITKKLTQYMKTDLEIILVAFQDEDYLPLKEALDKFVADVAAGNVSYLGSTGFTWQPSDVTIVLKDFSPPAPPVAAVNVTLFDGTGKALVNDPLADALNLGLNLGLKKDADDILANI